MHTLMPIAAERYSSLELAAGRNQIKMYLLNQTVRRRGKRRKQIVKRNQMTNYLEIGCYTKVLTSHSHRKCGKPKEVKQNRKTINARVVCPPETTEETIFPTLGNYLLCVYEEFGSRTCVCV